MVKKLHQGQDLKHQFAAESYEGYIRKKADRQITSRKEGALLARLRSGHCLGLAHYKKRLDPTKSAISPRCEEEDETVRHWLGCPASIRTQHSEVLTLV